MKYNLLALGNLGVILNYNKPPVSVFILVLAPYPLGSSTTYWPSASIVLPPTAGYGATRLVTVIAFSFSAIQINFSSYEFV